MGGKDDMVVGVHLRELEGDKTGGEHIGRELRVGLRVGSLLNGRVDGKEGVENNGRKGSGVRQVGSILQGRGA